MSDTSRTLDTVALDIGNGYGKINHPGLGKFLAIPAYVDDAASHGINELFVDTPESYRFELPEGEMQLIGRSAQSLSCAEDDDETSNGLWEKSKDEFYLHFLASLFVGLPQGVNSITVAHLLVTIQPKPAGSEETDCEKNANALKGTHKFWVAGRAVTLTIKKVSAYQENLATAQLVARTAQPSGDFAVVQFGKGTTHIQAYGANGNSLGDTVTLRGMAKLMGALQKRIRAVGNNLSPSKEELTRVVSRGDKEVTIGPKTVKLSPLLKEYKKGFNGLLDKKLEALPVKVSEVYLAGGAVSLASAWKPSGVQVQREWTNGVDPQFIELQGLMEISKVIG